MRIVLLCLLSLLLATINLPAQIDSTYIQPFDQSFSARIYMFDKFAGFEKQNENDESKDFIYKTNKPVSVGVGVSWKSFSFSFSQGFDIMRDKKRGNTKSLEFEHHGYGRKFVYDIFLQQHKGFYNEERNSDKTYITYPDIKLNMYGGSFQYVFNNKRFSYKAAFNQNERQVKSTGTFLVGGSIYYSDIRSDTIVLFKDMAKIHKNLQFGITGGYAHTWVISPRWFMTGSMIVGINMGNNYPSRFFKERMKIYPTLNGRFSLGYNAHNWSLGTSLHFNRVYLFFEKKESLSMDNLNLQLTFIMRFDWGNKFVNSTLNKAKDKLRM